MRPGGGKAKGAAFERQTCRALSLWVTRGEKEDCFWRSAMSGGRATVGHKAGKQHARQAGDISAVAPEGHALTDWFYIECKHIRELAIASMLLGRGTLWKFWQTARKEATKYKKEPMMIARQNGWPSLLCISYGGSRVLGLNAHTIAEFFDADMVILLFESALKRPFCAP